MPTDAGQKFEASDAPKDPSASARKRKVRQKTPRSVWFTVITSALVITVVAIAWLASRGVEVKRNLSSAADLTLEIKQGLISRDQEESQRLLQAVQSHTQAAQTATDDPVWILASSIPLIGENFKAITVVAETADTIARDAGAPLLNAIAVLTSGALTPAKGQLDVAAVAAVSPALTAAAETWESAAWRLEKVERGHLFPQVAQPLEEVTALVREAQEPLNLAAESAAILPPMLGSEGERNYLLLVQNNAEVRATGGLSGALAVITVDAGRMKLTAQAGGVELQKFSPALPVDQEQEAIYSKRLGAYIGDVNLTPDFPTAASTAMRMWQTRHGTEVDGVVAIDPVVLSHVLAVTGPLPLRVDEFPRQLQNLPTTLTAQNVVKTLLSDVYAELDNDEQDEVYAAAAKQVFESLTAGNVSSLGLSQALSNSAYENRLHIWSRHEHEQRVILSTHLGGSISSGPNAQAGSYGAFFNDGTGAKMDYYVQRTVQLRYLCQGDGEAVARLRLEISNNAPVNAATVLSEYVTGGGKHGVPAGSVQSNFVAYGPAEAKVVSAEIDGERTNFGSYVHKGRAVGAVTTRLAPGERRSVEFTFTDTADESKVNLLVTPTVEDVKKVVLPTEYVACS